MPVPFPIVEKNLCPLPTVQLSAQIAHGGQASGTFVGICPPSLAVHVHETYNASGPKFQSEDWLNPTLGYASQLSHSRGKKRRVRVENKKESLDPSIPLTRGQLKRLCRVESDLPHSPCQTFLTSCSERLAIQLPYPSSDSYRC